MAGSCCAFGDTADEHFNADRVAKELAQYRRKGPGPTTRRLRDGLVSAGLREGTVLDVGGGLGILSLELLDAGFSRAVVVDASTAYLAAASEEATRRGRSASTEFTHGDFLIVASKLAPSTVVTLDRVVCCYPSYEPLLDQALQLAKTGFAMSYPKDRWFVRAGIWLENAMRRRSRNPFRTFVHPPSEMIQIIERAGFRLASRRWTPVWSCDVFVKARESTLGEIATDGRAADPGSPGTPQQLPRDGSGDAIEFARAEALVKGLTNLEFAAVDLSDFDELYGSGVLRVHPCARVQRARGLTALFEHSPGGCAAPASGRPRRV